MITQELIEEVKSDIKAAVDGLNRNKNMRLTLHNIRVAQNGMVMADISDDKFRSLGWDEHWTTNVFPSIFTDIDQTIDIDIYGKFPKNMTPAQKILFRITWVVHKDWQNNIYEVYVKRVPGLAEREQNWYCANKWYKENIKDLL